MDPKWTNCCDVMLARLKSIQTHTEDAKTTKISGEHFLAKYLYKDSLVRDGRAIVQTQIQQKILDMYFIPGKTPSYQIYT